MNEFHFLRPNFLFLLFPMLALFWLMMRKRRDFDRWKAICSEDLIEYVIDKKESFKRVPTLLSLATIFFLVIAMAGPSWSQVLVPVVKQHSGLVIVLDLSPSMDAQDVKPSRLQRAIYKVTDILNMRKDKETALIVYSEAPFVVSPLTDDVATIKNLLPALSTSIMPAHGSKLHAAIEKGAEMLMQAGVERGNLLVLTSDLPDQELQKSIAMAKQKGVLISLLGCGTDDAAPIPTESGGFVKNTDGTLAMTKLSTANLKKLAKESGGIFEPMRADDQDIKTILGASSAPHLPGEKDADEHKVKWHDQGYLFVLIALPFVLLAFRRGIFLWLLFLLPQHLQAYSSKDLWQTRDQQARECFFEGDYEKAKELFQNQEWKAAAEYQLGEYETAANIYQQDSSADGHYNYGTAKAKLGSFQEAILAYQKAIELDPDHEDAAFNKKMIEEFLEKQKESEQDGDDADPKNGDKNQKQDQKGKSSSESENQEGNGEEGDHQESGDHSEGDHQQNKSQKGQEESSSQTPDSTSEPEISLDDLKEDYKDKLENEIKEAERDSPVSDDATFQGSPDSSESEEEEEDPRQRIDDQWLQRIPDDPGGLLRRKFLQQYRKLEQSKR